MRSRSRTFVNNCGNTMCQTWGGHRGPPLQRYIMLVESLQPRAMSVFIVLLLIAGPCLGQATQANASLEVVVKDPTGALINKAQVQLVRNGKSQSLSSTNQRGEARFNKVPAGRYQVHVEAAGFKAQDVDLDLTVGQHRQEVTLEIDAIKVDVDVEDE